MRNVQAPSTLPIRVICATKGGLEDFKNSNTGKSLIASSKVTHAELKLFTQNSRGLSDVYNEAIDESKTAPAILVFIHDDVLVPDFYWGNRIRSSLEKFDLIGVAGNKRRLPKQPGWIIQNVNYELDDYANLSGAIGQGNGFPPEKIDFFGPFNQECKLMDGVFLAAYSETLQTSGLKFDSQFHFHFYDLDFCRRAEELGLKMGTTDLTLIHQSYGQLNQQWINSYELYLQKWDS